MNQAEFIRRYNGTADPELTSKRRRQKTSARSSIDEVDSCSVVVPAPPYQQHEHHSDLLTKRPSVNSTNITNNTINN